MKYAITCKIEGSVYNYTVDAEFEELTDNTKVNQLIKTVAKHYNIGSSKIIEPISCAYLENDVWMRFWEDFNPTYRIEFKRKDDQKVHFTSIHANAIPVSENERDLFLRNSCKNIVISGIEGFYLPVNIIFDDIKVVEVKYSRNGFDNWEIIPLYKIFVK